MYHLSLKPKYRVVYKGIMLFVHTTLNSIQIGSGCHGWLRMATYKIFVCCCGKTWPEFWICWLRRYVWFACEIVLVIKNCSVINDINAILPITEICQQRKFDEKLAYLLYEYVSSLDEGRLAFHWKQLF